MQITSIPANARAAGSLAPAQPAAICSPENTVNTGQILVRQNVKTGQMLDTNGQQSVKQEQAGVLKQGTNCCKAVQSMCKAWQSMCNTMVKGPGVLHWCRAVL